MLYHFRFPEHIKVLQDFNIKFFEKLQYFAKRKVMRVFDLLKN